MEEQLVSLETAKLAKEKGFKELCFYYYNEDGKLQESYLENGSSTDVEFKVILTDLSDNYNSNNFRIKQFSSPTQSLLQKWLREVHNIHLTIFNHHAYTFKGNFYFVIGYDLISSMNNKLEPKKLSNTYEESLEIGLQEALKLI